MNLAVCLVENCGKPVHAKGCCTSHYKAFTYNKEKARDKYLKEGRTWHKRYIRAKAKAKSRDISFNLSAEEFVAVATKPCFYCKIVTTSSTGVGLDRIDNSQGYAAGNVLPCCGSCNSIRGDKLSVQETICIITVLEGFRRASAWRS